jgi:hypothetical protein|tara:strand:- start:955 stop:1581 length:627 start_codon:yes stop_codon:yes gene_type:complete
MALSKIQSQSVNLADDFAFTGTVTGAGGGKILQVKQTVFKGQFSNSASTALHEEVVTGLNCTITPTSASNKILVQYNVHIGATNYYDVGIKIYKNVTANSGAGPLGTKLLDSSGNAIEGTTANNRPTSVGVMNLLGSTPYYFQVPANAIILDHPNTTSALTYSFALSSYDFTSSSTWFVNRSSIWQDNGGAGLYEHVPVSMLTLMEVS